MVSRRAFLTGAACALGAPLINRGSFRLFAQTESEYSTLTCELIRESTVVDMLGLLTLDFKKLALWRSRPETFGIADFQKLKGSGITVFHPAVGYTEGDVFSASLADISAWDAFIAHHDDKFLRIDSPADLARTKESGKIGIVIGQQNSLHFRSVDDVDRFYNLGQRVSQLTYMHNPIGGGSSDLKDTGLSDYGAQVIARMNQVGMAVDVSHCGDRTTLDAIAASCKPPLVTHSNCRTLVPNSPRCKTDQAIRKMAAKGGVMGVTMVRYFVRSGGSTTIENVLDHVDHVAKLVGVEYVGVGTDVDLDGRDRRTALAHKNDLDGMDYAKKVFDLTEGLVRRKYSKADIELILGGNFRRVFSEIAKS